MSNKHLTQQRFTDFTIHPALLQALEQHGFDYCTPIQALALPIILGGQDILGQAQTGTGKTLTFLLATFHQLLSQQTPPERQINQPRALIMAPTRELAIQIHADAQLLAKASNLRMGLAYGGECYEPQLKVLATGVDILVGTPGRLLDYLKQQVINLKAIQVMVLDEADRLCGVGFIQDIRYLLGHMSPPQQRYNLLFSATLSERVRELAFEQALQPQQVVVESSQHLGCVIQEELFYPSSDEKRALLQTLIEQEWPNRCIVFANTKQCCEMLWGYLAADGHRVGLLIGDVPQKKRQQILADFSQGHLDILVATDVAARGLHVPAVTHVFNYDLPDDYQEYVHRIGRTGRADAEGCAISFACEQYALNLPAIETHIGHSLPVSQYETAALLRNLPTPLKSASSNRGHRPYAKRSGLR